MVTVLSSGHECVVACHWRAVGAVSVARMLTIPIFTLRLELPWSKAPLPLRSLVISVVDTLVETAMVFGLIFGLLYESVRILSNLLSYTAIIITLTLNIKEWKSQCFAMIIGI